MPRLPIKWHFLWKLTGTEQYAKNVINILNQWAATCTEVTSNDANHKLAAGAQRIYFLLMQQKLCKLMMVGQKRIKPLFKTWIVKVFASKKIKIFG